MTRIKICGLTREEDLATAIELGASAVGFIAEPSSPRYLPVKQRERLAKQVPPFVTRVSVFGVFNPVELPETIDVVQFVEAEPTDIATRVQTIKAFRVTTEMTVEEIVQRAERSQAILLDGYSPTAYGGTGKTVDFQLAAEVVRRCPIPVILAGGLNPDNVAQAIEQVKPYAVDVSSGIESSPGIKDLSKMRRFFEAVRSADKQT